MAPDKVLWKGSGTLCETLLMVGYVSFFPHTSSRYQIGWSIPWTYHNAKQTQGPPFEHVRGTFTHIRDLRWRPHQSTGGRCIPKWHSDWLQDRACGCSTGAMSQFHYLRTTTEGCYGAIACVAKQWLNILFSHAKTLSDKELIDPITKNRSMLKTLAEYAGQKSTSISTVRRLAEFLVGDQTVKDKGLVCKFIISAKPHGAPVTDHIIPITIVSAEDSMRLSYLHKWLRECLCPSSSVLCIVIKRWFQFLEAAEISGPSSCLLLLTNKEWWKNTRTHPMDCLTICLLNQKNYLHWQILGRFIQLYLPIVGLSAIEGGTVLCHLFQTPVLKGFSKSW